nr:DNA primase family protein [Rhodococcus sp. (in: high G+C Gram-positive bacteria)]
MVDAEIGRKSHHHTKHLRWAYVLVENHPDDLMYVSQIGWFYYDGTRWVEDADAARATQMVANLLRIKRSSATVDRETLQEIASCETAAGIRSVLELARTMPEFHFSVADLDADPNLLNVANGTVDLLDGSRRAHSPLDRMTKITRARFDPNARSGTWEKFLETSIPDAEVRGFLQRYVGYALSGRVTEHVLAILIGAGRNGKGVLYGALNHALGSYAGIGEPELFLSRQGGHPTGEMDLRGLRLVTVSETGQGAQLANGTVKRLVGGDKIKARRMRRDFVEFEPSHTPFLVTNHLPKVRGDDPALWARLRVVPFDVIIPEAERISDLPEQLELAADAILMWSIAGRHDYDARNGLDAPEAVLAATRDYQRAEDAVQQFLEQVPEQDSSGRALFSAMYARWVNWAERQSQPPLAKGEFRKALESRGITVRTGGASKQNQVHGFTLPTLKFQMPANGD